MVELRDEQALVVLSSSALGHIYVNSSHTLGPARAVVGNEAARFEPPDFSPWAHKTKLADELAPPFLERTNVLGTQALRIVSMYAPVPFPCGDFRAALAHAITRRTGPREPQELRRDVVGIATHARSLMGKVELCIAFGEMCLGPFPIRDVLDDRDEIIDGAARLAHAANGKIGPDNGAILADIALLDTETVGVAPECVLQHLEIESHVIR